LSSGIALALVSAAAYGGSDFLAGLASRRVRYARVALMAQLAATATVLVAVPFAGGHLSTRALAWGTVAGLGAATGTTALYRGLARGHMSVAGSISGVGAAALPVLAGLALGDRPSLLTLAGIVLILPAVCLIAGGGGAGGMVAGRRRFGGGVAEGMVAGVGFGLSFFALSRSGSDSGLWPTAAGAIASAVLIAGFALLRPPTPRRAGFSGRGTPGVPPVGLAVPVWLISGLAGVSAGGALVAYLLATRRGLLAVVAVVASLYPAATVALAWVVLRERSDRAQVVGLVLAGVAVVAISIG